MIPRAQLLIPHERYPRVPFGDCKAICSSLMCSVRSGGVLELELIQSHMAQKPVLRGEVGVAESGEDSTSDTRGYTHTLSGRM